MSVYSDIRGALAEFGYPVATNIYTGAAQSYFVLTVNALPDAYADDAPQYERNLVMVHLYCPHTQNTVATRKQVKRALQAAGFTYPSETDASDKTMQHIVFECQSAEAI